MADKYERLNGESIEETAKLAQAYADRAEKSRRQCAVDDTVPFEVPPRLAGAWGLRRAAAVTAGHGH